MAQTDFLICRCGEAFRPDGPVHVCKPLSVRRSYAPTLYSRWMDKGKARELDREIRRTGRDPAFADEAKQTTLYEPNGGDE